MPLRLAELAVRFGCELQGDPDALVERVAPLQEASPGSLAFLANPRYRRFLAGTRATAVVLDAGSAAECPVAALVARNPYATYARIAQLLHPAPPVVAGRHPSAVVEAGAQIDASACVGALAYVAAGATIGPRVFVGPGSVVLGGAQVGAEPGHDQRNRIALRQGGLQTVQGGHQIGQAFDAVLVLWYCRAIPAAAVPTPRCEPAAVPIPAVRYSPACPARSVAAALARELTPAWA